VRGRPARLRQVHADRVTERAGSRGVRVGCEVAPPRTSGRYMQRQAAPTASASASSVCQVNSMCVSHRHGQCSL